MSAAAHPPPSSLDMPHTAILRAPGKSHIEDAADDEPVRGHPTIHEIRCKTLLNRVRPPMPFRWSINPYRGCAHACAYCYARPSHITFDMDSGTEFEGHIFVKVNAVEVLRAELRRPGWRREPVTIGTVVDPYQPLEGRYRLTRSILHELATRHTPATIITKNTMHQRDLDILRRLQARAGCTIFVSVTSLDAGLLRRMEPGTPPPVKRLEAMRRLVEAGIPAGVIAAPLLPGITDGEESLSALAAAAAAHNARFFLAGALRLGEGIEPAFLPFLQRERPDLLPIYRRLYPSGYAPRAYVETLHQRVSAIRVRYSLPSNPPPLLPTEEPAQLALAW